MSCPENLLGYSFIIKGKVGRGRRPSLSFLNRRRIFIIGSSSRLSREVLLSLLVKLGLQMIVFWMCREHVLGIINLLSSLGRIWFSCHHCFTVWGHVLCFCCMVLLLGKPAWFCGYASLSWVIINLHGSPVYFYLQSPGGINYLITYFVPSFCPCHINIKFLILLFILWLYRKWYGL